MDKATQRKSEERNRINYPRGLEQINPNKQHQNKDFRKEKERNRKSILCRLCVEGDEMVNQESVDVTK